MDDSRSPKSRPVSLDEFAKLVATGALDRPRMDGGLRTLRRTMSRRYGVPPSETEELASQVVVDYLAEVRKDPTNPDKQKGAYMVGIARNRCRDTYRRARRRPETVELIEEDLSGPQYFEACRSAHYDRQAALVLSLHAGDVIRRHAQRDKKLLKGGLERIVEVVQLVAAASASTDSAFPAASAILIEEGVLGGNNTRRIQARFDRQPEVRREFSSSSVGSKSAGKPDPRGEPRLAGGAKSDSSADD